ncbi:MAG: FKBP-type peptidyl-prolyl cis-trans isomerase N-terminal domain-containing protein [Longimicrobiales bacterium]
MLSHRTLIAAIAASVVATSCGQAPASLESDDQKASYAIGLDMGNSLEPAADHVDMAALLKGIEDALAEADPAVEPEELREVMARFNTTIREEQEAKRLAEAETNAAEGEAYLAENGGREGVVTTESGLQYEVLREGEGVTPESGQRAVLHYKGTLPDGTEFDSSYGGEPAEFGVDQLIPGFTEALKLMNVGSHYRVVVPSDIAYGPQGGQGAIGPNQTLVFEIELLGIQ